MNKCIQVIPKYITNLSSSLSQPSKQNKIKIKKSKTCPTHPGLKYTQPIKVSKYIS